MKTEHVKPIIGEFWHVADIAEYRKELARMDFHGLALDIDETLSFTLAHWFVVLRSKFGNLTEDENLTINDLIKKYRYASNNPQWQTEAPQLWMQEARTSNDLQTELPLIENANSIVQKINQKIPIGLYLTNRPISVVDGTAKWLTQHNFPKAPIIARPENVPHEEGTRWKAETLAYLFPYILGIVDDHPDLVRNLPNDYPGTVYLYNSTESPRTDISVIPCEDWGKVLSEVVKLD